MSVKDREGILEEVDLQVKEANVASLAIAARVDAEVNRRADLVAKGLVQYEKYEDEMKAKKPDVPAALNEDGEEIRPAGFTKGVFEARKKLQGKMDKLEGAINRALEQRDYAELEKLVGK